MFFPFRFQKAAFGVALAALFAAGASPPRLNAQQPDLASELSAVPLPEPSAYALPLSEDRGAADLEQTVKRLGTTASVLFIDAHPDDEDGALLTYLTRGLGARATLMSLTRGEGGLNAMSAEGNDALGLIRTNELLRADEAYGADQLWGTEADFGFSKSQEEAFSRWGHERVLYDAVLAVRQRRPQVIVATFVGGITDGHGQHQVSGEIAQEAFKDAADPKVFPEQLKDGLQPWQAQAVYSRVPFAPISDKGMFDSATGKYAPAKFHNYVTGEWINGRPSTDVSIPEGTWDPVLGRTYVQIAREGWGEQKSQHGGASPQLSSPASAEYHLWAATPGAANPTTNGRWFENDLFGNSKVYIDTSLEGLARLAGSNPPAWLTDGLHQIQSGVAAATPDILNKGGVAGAHALVPVYRQALDLYSKIQASNLSSDARAELEFILAGKIDEFQTAFKDLLGLDLVAFRTGSGSGRGGGGGPGGGGTADETSPSVAPGQAFSVRTHIAQAVGQTELSKVWLVSFTGSQWKSDDPGAAAATSAPATDRTLFHAPQHRAALLRYCQPAVATALLRALAA
jgi:LmbE family N-acetylglucosaminyl deacetylase